MKDPALRSVALAARGLWIDMLCLMFESSRRGYLQQANGQPLSLAQLARMTGCSTDEVAHLVQELEDAGVCSRTEHGTIYSRRLVREEHKRESGRARMDRFREKGGGDPAGWTAIRIPILKRDGDSCAYCGQHAITVDHVLPKSRGGTEDPSNLVACCKPCNNRKGTSTPSEARMSFWKFFDTSPLRGNAHAERVFITPPITPRDTPQKQAPSSSSSTSVQNAIPPEMVMRGVLSELCLSGRELSVALDEICRAEMGKGRDASELRDALIASWRDYEASKPNMTAYTKGPTKFFGDGDWRHRAGWPWKDGKQPSSQPKPLTLTEKVRLSLEAR